jgi:hypothetical protein
MRAAAAVVPVAVAVAAVITEPVGCVQASDCAGRQLPLALALAHALAHARAAQRLSRRRGARARTRVWPDACACARARALAVLVALAGGRAASPLHAARTRGPRLPFVRTRNRARAGLVAATGACSLALVGCALAAACTQCGTGACARACARRLTCPRPWRCAGSRCVLCVRPDRTLASVLAFARTRRELTAAASLALARPWRRRR